MTGRLATALAALALLMLPSAALAGWQPLSAADGTNIDEVATLRTPDGNLHVVWQRATPGHVVHDDLMRTVISPSGSLGAPQTIAADWIGVGNAAIVRDAAGQLLIASGVTNTLAVDDPLQGLAVWRSADNGATWTLQPLEAANEPGFADTISAAIGSDGVTPFFAWKGLTVHRGTDRATPSPDFNGLAGFGCCGYEAGIARDDVTGQLVGAWYSNGTNREGVWAQQIDQATGNPLGAPSLMPGSVTNGDSSASLARTPVVSRPGKPGVFVAYAGGYPTTKKALVWRYGAAKSTVVGTRRAGLADVGVAAAADGRLWAFWSGGTRVYARRSNPSLSAWGAIVSLRARRGTDTIYKLAGDAGPGALDLFAAFSPSSTGDVQTWHTRVLPGLSLKASPARLKLGKTYEVELKVTDAGDAVAGAKVKLAGASATTSAKGVATFDVGPFAKRTWLKASAKKDGYTAAKTRVRVK